MSILRSLGLLAVLAAFIIVAQPVQAATFTVDSLADTADANAGDGNCDDGSGVCTLRAAIEEANALGGADTIGFSVTGTITLGSGLPSITQALTINGPGANQLTVSGDNAVRPFYISGTDAVLSGLKVSNGYVSSIGGGGIYLNGIASLDLDSVVLENNVAVNTNGGGISCSANSTTISINNSTIRGNSATGSGPSYGGGIYCPSSILTISNSTISGNTATSAGGASGGGIWVYTGTVTIINSTFSDNAANSTSSAGASGGGIWFYTGIGTITNSTITVNSASSASGSAGEGGGIVFLSSGSLNLANNIISGNSADTSANCFIAGTLISHHNIEDINTCGLAGSGDLVNTDPLLDVLGDYGGPTQTHYLLTGSLAIDTGDDGLCPATDQRGISRPQDGDFDDVARCDMGAVEYSTSDGIDPHIQILPPELDFGTVSGNGIMEKNIYVLNDGKIPLILGNVGMTDPLEAPFSIRADACSDKVLQAGTFCTLTVRLDPTTALAAMLLGGLSFSGLFVIGMVATSRRYKKQWLALYLCAVILGALLTACGGGTTITDYTGSFDIPSNDPDTASITVNVKGSIEQ